MYRNFLISNNARRYAGLRPLRKSKKGKRFLTRNKSWESFCAFIYWLDN